MADLLTFLNQRGRFTPLSLSRAATLASDKGLPGFRGRSGDTFVFEKYGTVEVEGVPFEIDDPQDGRVPNMIALQRPFRRGGGRGRRGSGRGFFSTLPESTSVPCSGQVGVIHLLGGVALGGFPINRTESTSLVVRCNYEDGTSVDHELINAKHIANYREKVDVPESKFAMDVDGKQIRYLKIDVDSSKAMKSIEFIKGEGFAIPLVFAVTVEGLEETSN
jgi:hypothetical protein